MRLTAKQADQPRSGGLRIEVLASADRRVLVSTVFSHPTVSRTRSLQANQYWAGGASVSCWGFASPTMTMVFKAGGSTFGYPFGQTLYWHSMIQTYNPTTRAYTWYTDSPWMTHYAGYASSTGALEQSWNLGAGLYAAGAIQIRGGDWNYVPISAIVGSARLNNGWCIR
jgi:hypothetical protein